MNIEISEEDLKVHRRLMTDYAFFARHIQKIDPKDLKEPDLSMEAQIAALSPEEDQVEEELTLAGTIPLIFYPAQLKLHNFVEQMKAETGRVRAAIVKPRQVGWSTYIAGRGHWLAAKTPGMKIFIVCHNADSTRKFLRRVKKLCLAAPPTVTPGRAVDNSKELLFKNGASYAIATAGSPDALRSDASHYLHASEEPYWKDAVATTAAVIPALSDGVGSEGFRESSSKGKGTPWHTFIQETQAGLNEWRLFFDAWYNHPKYQMACPPDFEFDNEAIETGRLHNLTRDQLYWRAMKIRTLRALWLFKQEFPATVDESFQAPEGTFFNPDAVYRARKNKLILDAYAPLIMGVDPARTGDRTCISFRQGNVWIATHTWPKMDDMRLVGIIAHWLRQCPYGNVAKCFIDYAIGEGVASRLRELSPRFRQLVQVIHFGGKAREDRFMNMRMQMAWDAGEWFGDTGEHVQIPDNDDVSSDLLAIPEFIQQSGSEKLKLMPKDEIKKLYGKSPDIFDSFILTFAYPVPLIKTPETVALEKALGLHKTPVSELSSIYSDFDSF